jgi:SSS family solute:Na+ symporter
MLHLTILLAYGLGMVLLGLWLSRRVRSVGDFYVAGRNLGVGLLTATLLAANIGAGSTVGAAGLGYRYGLAAWWWVGSAGIGSLFLAWTVGPKIWQIARDRNLFTVGDFLEFRYDRRVRLLVSILLWGGSLAILAGQLIAIAWILQVTLGIGRPLGSLIGALVATIYFTAGGLEGAARVNLFQVGIKLVGFGAAATFLLGEMGGWSSFLTHVREVDGSLLEGGWGGSAGGPGWQTLLVLGPSFLISPGLIQKIFGAKDRAVVRRGVGLNALFLLGFGFLPVFFGLVARVYLPGLENAELALPGLLLESLPAWLGGLLLGALFAAEVSTADAVLFMLTTSLTRDLFRDRLGEAEGAVLARTRWIAIGAGLLGSILALWLPTVIEALILFYTLLTAALFLPLLAGLYLPSVGARQALASIVLAVTVTFLLGVVVQRGATLFPQLDGLSLPFPPLLWGILAGLLPMIQQVARQILRLKGQRRGER